MVKIQYNFVINGDWQKDGDVIELDYMPNVDDVECVDGTYYRVIEVEHNDDDIVNVYLD